MWGCAHQVGEPRAYHQKGFHLVLLLDRDLVYIPDASVATRGDATMFFDRLEDGPSLITVQWITCQPKGKEKGFNRFWAG